MYEVNMGALQAELERRGWGPAELAAIWRIGQEAAAACMNRPQHISCRRMLMLQQAAGWSGVQAARIFFAPGS